MCSDFQKTVFLLGAGASEPYGLPLGEELKLAIQDELARVRQDDSLKALGFKNTAELVSFRTSLSQCGLKSIDQFLEGRDESEQMVGKRLIAIILMRKEQPGRLYPTSKAPVKGNWLEWLFGKLRDRGLESIGKNLTIATLNYDRSVEHYLFNSLSHSTGLPAKEVEKLLSGISFIHPYGSLGRLPWQKGAEPARPYDIIRRPVTHHEEDEQTQKINDAAGSLRVMGEERDQEPFDLVTKKIKEADVVVALGLGFHNRENFERLGVRAFKGSCGIASGMGLTKKERSDAEAILGPYWEVAAPSLDSLALLQEKFGFDPFCELQSDPQPLGAVTTESWF